MICKDCIERTPYCHGTCSKFKKYMKSKAIKNKNKKKTITKNY